MNFRKVKARSFRSIVSTNKYLSVLLLLVASSFSAILFSAPPAYATGPVMDLKAIVITCSADGSGYYSEPYNQQIAQNMMRSWGVPFDTIDVQSISASTFWDSTNHINKYQFIVYFGCISFSEEPSLSSTIKNAVSGAITNGTNAIFVGAGVDNWMNLFGLSLSGTGDCPTAPQSGGKCFTGSNVLKFGIKSNYCGVVSGDTCWVKGKVYNTNNTAAWPSGNALPDYKMPTLSWNGTHGALFLNATANATVYPDVIYRNYGANHAQIWWWGGTEGAFSDYLEGWAGTFDNQEHSSGCSPSQSPATAYYGCGYYQGFAPAVQLFYYGLKNVTNVATPIIMPWSTDGNAEIVRVEDHSSICSTFTPCSTSGADNTVAGMTERGIVGEMNVNLNGWSNSVPLTLTSGPIAGATNSPCTTGYQYHGTLTTTWNSRTFLVCPKVTNSTFTTDGGTGTTGTHTATVHIADSNTSTIVNVELLMTVSGGSPSWTASLKDSTGATIWTSSAQTTAHASPTWVKFPDINVTGGLSGYVNKLQGNDKLTVTVSSGTVKWENQSGTQANWVITGRGAWDIVYIDPTAGTKNFATAKAIMPDSIRMASGSLYPRANSTFYITGIPGLVQPADIVGDGNSGAPTAVNIQTFFNATDWTNYGATQVTNWKALVADGWIIVTNGWTHAKTAAGGEDNDFIYGNGTTMGATEQAKRVTDIKTMLDNVIGSAYVSSNWAFGTAAQSYYPGTAQMVAGGFMEAQLATQNVGVQSFITTGFYQSASTGGGSLYGIAQGNKVTGSEAWTASYNETRDMYGIIETHSDSTSPWNDYDQALKLKATQQYDIKSTWFTTSTAALKFWNTTLYSVQHVKNFIWNPSTDQISLTFYTGTSTYIDQTNFNNPIVFRLPEAFDSLGLTSAVDNQTSGSLTNSTANWRYYQINVGHKWTAFTFTYSEPTTTLTFTTEPIPLTGAISFDYAQHSSPYSATVYINSVHAVAAISPISCGVACDWVWSSWSDSGAQSHDYTVPGASPTLDAVYTQTSPVPSGVTAFVSITVNNTSSVNWIKGTQWPIIIDWNAYSAHLASNLQNVIFFDNFGNHWNAWNENASTSSATKGVVWVKSLVPLNIHATYNINMGFYSTGTNNYSPTGSWGEAPQLSGTYGQYDNGAKVFEQYVNFVGSSCPTSQGTWVCGAGSSVSNGLTLVDGTNSYAYSTNTYSGNHTQILDMLADFPTPTSDNPTFAGYANNVNINSGPYAYGFAERSSSYSASGPVGFWAKTGSGVGHTTAFTTGTNVYTVYAPVGNYAFQENYGTALTLSNGATDSNQSMGANNDWSSGGQTLTVTWMRLRVYGGTFVSTTFGSVLVTYTLTMSAGTGGTVLPASDAWGSGSVVYIQAFPSGGNSFVGWTGTGSGSFTGTTNPTSVTVNNAMSETAAFGVTEHITVTMAAGPVTTITIGGACSTSYGNGTFTTAHSHTFVASPPSCSISYSPPSNSTNVRYIFTGSGHRGTWSYTVASSGGDTLSNTLYEQLQNTYSCNPSSPTTFDGIYACTATGTSLGTGSSTISTINTSNGGGTVGASGWADYNTVVSLPASLGSWAASGTRTFTDTTGGNSHIVSYTLAPLTVTEHITITMGAGPVTTITISGCSPSYVNSTFTTAHTHTFTTNANCAISYLPPSNSSSLEYVFTSGGNHGTWSYTTAASGTDTKSNTLYEKLNNSYRVTPTNPIAFDAILSIPVSGTIDGASSTTGCTLTTAVSGGAVVCAAFFDYNTQVTIQSPVTVSAHERWAQACGAGGNQFTQTTGGNLDNCNYVMELQNTYSCNPLAPTTFDGIYNCTATGTLAGVSSSTICTVATSNGGGEVSCTGYADYNLVVSLPASLGAWTVSGTRTFTDTTGGNTHIVNYQLIVSTTTEHITITMGAGPVTTITISGCSPSYVNATFTTAHSHTFTVTSNCSINYSPPANSTNVRYIFGGDHGTWSYTTAASGSETKSNTLYEQLQNTYQATPTSNSNHWDFVGSIPVTGTKLGVAGQTGCTISTSSGGGAANCLSFFDYSTQVTVTPTIGVSGTERWGQNSGNTFGDTTGGNLHNVNFVRQWLITFVSTPFNCGSTSPPLGNGFENDATSFNISTSPRSGCTFTLWAATSGIALGDSTSIATTATPTQSGTITVSFIGQPIPACGTLLGDISTTGGAFTLLSVILVVIGSVVVIKILTGGFGGGGGSDSPFSGPPTLQRLFREFKMDPSGDDTGAANSMFIFLIIAVAIVVGAYVALDFGSIVSTILGC